MASTHYGVTLIAPSGRRASWRARYRNPKDGKLKWERVPEGAAKTARGRERWADAKVNELRILKLQIEAGIIEKPSDKPKRGDMTLRDAAAMFFADLESEFSESTIYTYSLAINEFLDWAECRRVTMCSEVDLDVLMDWRRMVHAKTNPGGGERSRETLNRETRNVGRMIRYLARKRRAFPQLSTYDLDDAFELLKLKKAKKDFLRIHEIQKVLEACIRADKDAKAIGVPHVGPLFLFSLMTGMRTHELLALRWKDVHLDALDGTGAAVGEIHVADDTKTGHRVIGLEASPAARRLLVAMKLRSGGKGQVFPLTSDQVPAAYRRLRREYGCPEKANIQCFRRTCETFAVNSPIMTLAQAMMYFGHTEATALKSYIGLLRGIPRDVVSQEQAMQIEDVADQIIRSVSAPAEASARARGLRSV